jgi:hypothetical protein
VTAVVGFASVAAVTVFGADPTAVATIAGAGTGLLGALVTLVAGQPPTLTPGDTYSISTPKGQPNYEATVANPPAPTQPVVEAPK